MTTVATHTKSTIMPGLRYQDAPAAIEWLCNVLGFERHAVFSGPNGTIAHAELTLNGSIVMLGSQKQDEYGRSFKSPKELGGFETCGMYVLVSDADAIYRHADGRRADCAPNREHALRESGVWPEGSGGTYLDRRHVRSMDQARVDHVSLRSTNTPSHCCIKLARIMS